MTSRRRRKSYDGHVIEEIQSPTVGLVRRTEYDEMSSPHLAARETREHGVAMVTQTVLLIRRQSNDGGRGGGVG